MEDKNKNKLISKIIVSSPSKAIKKYKSNKINKEIDRRNKFTNKIMSKIIIYLK